MKRLMLTMAVVGTLGMAPAPVPADAATAAAADCLVDSWHSCDSDFPSSSSEELIAIRGWCYLIRWGLCLF